MSTAGDDSRIHFSPVLQSRARGGGSVFSVRSVELSQLRERALPVLVLDDFRVSQHIFGPHPHAGFSAVTYVLQDSPGGLRSRDSLGNDVVVGPGGIVWTQAGSGVLHDEMPAEIGRELHGLQVFVNLSAKNKLAEPRVLKLDGKEVPEWRSDLGDRVRVAVGRFDGVSSPLVPAEPFDLLDIELKHSISFDLREGRNMLLYVVQGAVVAFAQGREDRVPRHHAVALRGNGRASFYADGAARFIVLAGQEIREPVVSDGSFIMNDRSQIQAAMQRYSSGAMGKLSPLADR